MNRANASPALSTSGAAGGDRLNGRFAPQASSVRLVHGAVPGRVRLAVPGLKHEEALARTLETEASRWRGVRRVSASVTTGNLLLEFDPALSAAGPLSERVQALLNSVPPRLPSSSPANRPLGVLPATANGRRRLGDPGQTASRLQSNRRPSSGPVAGPAGLIDTLEVGRMPPPQRPSLGAAEAAVITAAVIGAGAMLIAVRRHGHNLVVDQAPLELAEAIHHPALTSFMRGASRLVEPPLLWVGTLAAMGLGAGRTTPGQLPWLPPVAVFGGGSLVGLLKAALRRGRPGAFEHLVAAGGYSLPSGHAFMAVCLYGLLLHHGLRWLNARAPAERRAAGLLVAAALTAILLVGASRVYLGVHYLTDVLAGYALALLWLLLLFRFVPRPDGGTQPGS